MLLLDFSPEREKSRLTAFLRIWNQHLVKVMLISSLWLDFPAVKEFPKMTQRDFYPPRFLAKDQCRSSGKLRFHLVVCRFLTQECEKCGLTAFLRIWNQHFVKVMKISSLWLDFIAGKEFQKRHNLISMHHDFWLKISAGASGKLRFHLVAAGFLTQGCEKCEPSHPSIKKYRACPCADLL